MASYDATIPTSEVRSTARSPFHETQLAQARHEFDSLRDAVQSAIEHEEAANKRVAALE
jgi:ferritin